jgi:hypothetical protein
MATLQNWQNTKLPTLQNWQHYKPGKFTKLATLQN